MMAKALAEKNTNKPRDLKRFKELWRPHLQEAVSRIDYKVTTFYCGGEPAQIAKTDWVNLILDCLPLILDSDRLHNILQTAPQDDEALPADLNNVLPIRSKKELLRRYETSTLPVGGPPKILLDENSGRTVSQATGVLQLHYHGEALKHFMELRQHHSHVLLGSLQKAINAYKSVVPSKRGRHQKTISRFPTPPSTKWEEITITFVSGESIRIKAGDVSKTYKYAQIGFADGRSADKPGKLWVFFHGIARVEGEFDWSLPMDLAGRSVDLGDRTLVQKRVSDLRKILKRIMDLQDDPFYPYWSKTKYETRFTLQSDASED